MSETTKTTTNILFHKVETEGKGKDGRTVNSDWLDISLNGRKVGYINKNVGGIFFQVNLLIIGNCDDEGFLELEDAKEFARQALIKHFCGLSNDNPFETVEEELESYRVSEPTEWAAATRFVYDSIIKKARLLANKGLVNSSDEAIAKAFEMQFNGQRYFQSNLVSVQNGE